MAEGVALESTSFSLSASALRFFCCVGEGVTAAVVDRAAAERPKRTRRGLVVVWDFSLASVRSSGLSLSSFKFAAVLEGVTMAGPRRAVEAEARSVFFLRGGAMVAFVAVSRL